MARMLEALRKLKRLPPAEVILRAPFGGQANEPDSDDASSTRTADGLDDEIGHSSKSDLCDAASAALTGADTEEIPFIEVGGRGSPVDASPSVLAAARKPGTPIVHYQAGVPPQPPVLIAEQPIVSFRPLPPESPSERFAPELVTFHRPDDAVSRQYRTLVRDLERQLLTNTSTVLLFIMPIGTETPDALLNTAIAAAKEQRVLVVEAVSCGVAERFGLRTAPGLADVIADRIALPSVVQRSGLERLDVLTAGRLGENDAAISAAAVRRVLDELRRSADRVYVCAVVADSGAIQPWLLGCDSVFLVVPAVEADSANTREWMRRLRNLGGPLQGCILTAG